MLAAAFGPDAAAIVEVGVGVGKEGRAQDHGAARPPSCVAQTGVAYRNSVKKVIVSHSHV
jgi:hypothetical protein